jgi:hypothetical protein
MASELDRLHQAADTGDTDAVLAVLTVSPGQQKQSVVSLEADTHQHRCGKVCGDSP